MMLNEEAVVHAPSPINCMIAAVQAHWTSAAMALVAAVAGASALATLAWDETLAKLLTVSSPSGPDEGSASAVLGVLRDTNVALLSAQPTLLGLVYPIVIALISVLFGSRSSGGARLLIFIRQKGAIRVGTSALRLCAATTAALALGALLPLAITVGFTAVNLRWFLANLLGIGLFLRGTLAS